MDKEVMVEMPQIVFEQIEKVRISGKTNMFDTQAVQWLAFHAGDYEAVNWIEENKRSYVRFLFNGQ